MKRQFQFASMALASVLAMTSCSKDEVSNVTNGEGGTVDALTIKLSAPAMGRANETATPEGNESRLNTTTVYYMGASGSGQSDYKYKKVTVGQNQSQVTVKYVQEGSTVYVVSNGTVGTQGGDTPFTSDPYASVDGSGSTFPTTTVAGINKKYVGTLTKDGSFLMSGSAIVTKAQGEGPITMTVQMKRDLAKVAFSVNKKASDTEYPGTDPGKTDKGFWAPAPTGPEGIIIKRSAAKVGQFVTNGVAEWGYDLDTKSNYTEDYASNETNESGKYNKWDGFASDLTTINTTQSNSATDFTFAYKWDASGYDANRFIFPNFYVLPNYASDKVNSTIIILATKVQKATTQDGDYSDDQTIAQSIRYYKARISNTLETALTQKNTQYQITASLYGPGKATVEEAMQEDQKDDLIISISVQPWDLVISNQDIQ